MFRGVVNLEFVRQPLRFGRWERLVQLTRCMRIQLVHDQHDLLDIGEMHVDQVLGVPGGGVLARAEAAPAVTPKTQTPNEARALSNAFATVAKALAPSVVRIDVESEQPRVARQDRRQLPPDIERFFRFFGDGLEGPPQGPGRGTGSSPTSCSQSMTDLPGDVSRQEVSGPLL